MRTIAFSGGQLFRILALLNKNLAYFFAMNVKGDKRVDCSTLTGTLWLIRVVGQLTDFIQISVVFAQPPTTRVDCAYLAFVNGSSC